MTDREISWGFALIVGMLAFVVLTGVAAVVRGVDVAGNLL